MTNNINYEKAKGLIQNKKELYDAMVRNQNFMADYKSPCMSIGYLLDCKEQNVYVLKTKDVRLRNCLTPPPKYMVFDAIRSKLRAEAHAVERSTVQYLGFDEDQLPDSRWLLAVLSTLDPDHEFFSKNFVYEAEKKQPAGGVQVVDNQDGFYSGLPTPKRKRKAK